MSKKHDENCECNCPEDMEFEDCECDHEDYDYEEEMDIIYLTLDDDTELECAVLGIFEVDDFEYIALVPLDDDQVFLYRYEEDGDEFDILNIEDQDEFETVSEAFQILFAEEPLDFYDDEDFEYEDDED